MELENKVVQLGVEVEHIKEDMSEIKKQNAAIYKIANSVELMAKDLGNLQKDVQNISDKQDKFEKHIVEIDNRPAKSLQKVMSGIGEKALWLVIGGVAAFLLYQALPFLKG